MTDIQGHNFLECFEGLLLGSRQTQYFSLNMDLKWICFRPSVCTYFKIKIHGSKPFTQRKLNVVQFNNGNTIFGKTLKLYFTHLEIFIYSKSKY